MVLIQVKSAGRFLGLKNKREKTFLPFKTRLLKKGLSVAQNIDQLFFTETAQPRNEFDALYALLFKRPENYLKVIECLSDGRKTGMTREDILRESKLSDGGTFSTILEESEECGFIRRFASADTAETIPSYPHPIMLGKDTPLNYISD